MPGPKTLAVDILLLFTVIVHAIFLSTSTQAQVSHATSRNQLKRRHSKSSTGKLSTNFVPTYNWEQKEYVKAHNDLREEAKVPPLQWHPDLTSSSQAWAMELRSTCDYRSHSKGNKYGENIYWSLYKEFTPTDVVNKWHSERSHFDHETNLCTCHPETDTCECGHYLNVIWKNTQWVGCSNAVYCNEAKGVIVVCQYDPIGNYKGVNPLKPLSRLVSGALQLTRNITKNIIAAAHHVDDSDTTHARQSSTSTNIGVSHTASINTDDKAHARQTTSTSIHNDNSAPHVSPPPQSPINSDTAHAQQTSINNDKAHARQTTSISHDSSAPAHVPPPSINTGSSAAHVPPPPAPLINDAKSAGHSPPTPPMQSGTTSSNPHANRQP